jgi:hypothetical protein
MPAPPQACWTDLLPGSRKRVALLDDPLSENRGPSLCFPAVASTAFAVPGCTLQPPDAGEFAPAADEAWGRSRTKRKNEDIVSSQSPYSQKNLSLLAELRNTNEVASSQRIRLPPPSRRRQSSSEPADRVGGSSTTARRKSPPPNNRVVQGSAATATSSIHYGTVDALEDAWNMNDVQRARKGGHRKDEQQAYWPDALMFDDWARLREVRGSLDASGWGIFDSQLYDVGRLDVSRISLSSCFRVTDAGIQQLCRGLSHGGKISARLTHLSIAGCKIGDVSAEAIQQCVPNLTFIDVSSTEITDDGLHALLCASSCLQSLVAQNCHGITDRGLGYILGTLKRRRKLRLLNLSGCLRFSDDGMIALLSEAGPLEDLRLADCHQLTALALLGLDRARFTSSRITHLDLQKTSISDTALEYISRGCKHLVFLCLADCRSVTDVGLDSLATYSPPLQVLDLTRCTGISDEGISMLIGSAGSSLKELTLSGCAQLGDPSLKAIGAICSNLKKLVAVDLSLCSDIGLGFISTGCRKLRVLDWSCAGWKRVELSRQSRVPKFGDAGLQLFCAQLKCLTELRLDGASKLTDKTLESVAGNCSSLEILSLKYCSLISDKGIAAVAAGCPRLRYIRVNGCHLIGDAAVRSVARPSLRSLDVSGCRRVTNAALLVLATYSPGLESLRIADCEWVGDAGLKVAIRAFKWLTTLDVRGLMDATDGIIPYLPPALQQVEFSRCPQISGAGIDRAAAMLPYCKRESDKRALRPAPLACRLLNAYYQGLYLSSVEAAIRIQGLYRGVRARTQWAAFLRNRAWATIALQTSLRRMFAVKAARHLREEQKRRVKSAIVLQKCFRRHYVNSDMLTLQAMKNAASALQRVFRGASGRLRARRMKFIMLRALGSWERFRRGKLAGLYTFRFRSLPRTLVVLMEIAYRRQAFDASVLITRSLIRHCAGLRERRRVAAELLALQQHSARILQKAWRFSYRRKWALRGMRLELQAMRRAALLISAWWHKVSGLSFRREAIKRVIRARHAAISIQQSYRSMRARTLVKRVRRHRALARMAWRRFYCRLRLYPSPAAILCVQRCARRYIRRKSRRKACVDIQRVYRGFMARKVAVRLRALNYMQKAIILQRMIRGHLARTRVFVILVAEDRASRCITRAIRKVGTLHRFRKEVAKKRSMAEERQRVRLLRRREEALAQRRKEEACVTIQRHWRLRQAAARSRERKALDEAKRLRDELNVAVRMEEAKKRRAEALKKAKQSRGLLSGWRASKSAAANPLGEEDLALDDADAKKSKILQLRKTAEEREAEEKAQREREELMSNSILNHQSNSIVQEGLTKIVITVGRTETNAFSAAQDYLKATKQPYLMRGIADLANVPQSGLGSSPPVCLWFATGAGKGVFTNITVEMAQGHRSETAQKTREKAALQNGVIIVSNSRCNIELHCRIRTRDSGIAPSVDSLTAAFTKEEERQLKKDGYDRVTNFDMRKAGLAALSLWVHRKASKKRPAALNAAAHRLKPYPWFSDKIALLMEKYALIDEDVLALHAIFSETDYTGEDTIDTLSFFAELHEPLSVYGMWLFKTVNARSTELLQFPEYVEIVCFMCMFDASGILRWAFGALDSNQKMALSVDDFSLFVDAVTEHERGIAKNFKRLALKGFEKYAFTGEFLDFPNFVRICELYPRLTFPLHRLHSAMQKRNLGVKFWDLKKMQMSEVRHNIGVKLI